MRKNIVAGNWKMNKTLEEGNSLASEIVNIVANEVQDDTIVILNPPYIHLNSVNHLGISRRDWNLVISSGIAGIALTLMFESRYWL